MKRIFLLSCIMTLVMSVTAQSGGEKVVMLKPFLGHDSKALSPPVRLSSGARNAHKLLPVARLERIPILLDEGDATVDTSLLVKNTIVSDGNVESIVTYEYNDYGLLSLEYQKSPGSDYYGTYKYNYGIGIFNYWTSREILSCVSDEPDVWRFKSYEERDIDESKRITAYRVYGSLNDGPDGYTKYLSNEVRYDYSHVSSGVETFNAQYNENGNIINLYEIEWFEPASSYVLLRNICDTFKIEATIEDNTVHTSGYAREDRGDGTFMWIHDYDTYNYYGDESGQLDIRYDTDGEVVSAVGSKYVIERDVPSEGYITKTLFRYDSADGTWHNSGSRELFMGCFDEESLTCVISFGVDGVYITQYYDSLSGEWVTDSSNKYEWLYGDILKSTNSRFGFTATSYGKYKVNEDGIIEEVGNMDFFQDGSFVVSGEVVDCPAELGMDNYATMNSYFDSEGNVEMKIIFVSERPAENLYNDRPDVAIYKYNFTDSKWESTTSYMWHVYSDMYAYYYNSNGYIASQIFYKWKNGTYVVNSDQRYNYRDDGYSVELWNNVSDDGSTEELELTNSEDYMMLENDTLQVKTFAYEGGNLLYASMYKEKDEIYWDYGYKDGKYILYSVYGMPVYSTWNGDILTTIYRYVDADWNVVNESKTVSGMTYYYDKIIKQVAYPENKIDDDLPGSGNYFITPLDKIDESYVWNSDKNDWDINYANNLTCNFEDDAISLETSYINPLYGHFLSTTTFYFDGYNRINKCTVDDKVYSTSTDVVASNQFYAEEYAYNNNGTMSGRISSYYDLLASPIPYRSDENRYEYSDFSVIANSIDKVETEDSKGYISVVGYNIVSLDGNDIVLYNLNGQKVATSVGSVVAPCSGMYIVRSGGKTFKVFVR